MGTAHDVTLHVKQVIHRTITFQEADDSPYLIGTIPAGAVVTAVEGLVTEVFDAGTSNQLEVGTLADQDLLAQPGDIALTAVALTRYIGKAQKFDAETDLYAIYDQEGTAATAGSVDIMVEYYVIR